MLIPFADRAAFQPKHHRPEVSLRQAINAQMAALQGFRGGCPHRFYVRNIAGLALIFVIQALAIKYSLGVPVLTGHGTTFHHSHKKHGSEK